MFPALKYLAVDYTYEALAKQKLMNNCLLVPVPHHLDQSNGYCYKGTLFDDTYRRPWSRGSLMAKSRLSVSGSVLSDLNVNGSISNFQERRNNSCLEISNYSLDTVPSSNPSSQTNSNKYTSLWITKEQHALQKEEFFTLTAKDVTFHYEDLFLQEHVVFQDYLSAFSRKMPRLYNLLERLKTFIVEDPLSINEKEILDEIFFRKCMRFTAINNGSKQQNRGDNHKELCCKFPVLIDESFMLPNILELSNPFEKKLNIGVTELKNILGIMGEIMQEEGAWKDTLKTGTNTDTKHTLELSQYCPSFKTREDMSENIIDVLEQIDQASFRLYTQMELEPPFTPTLQPVKIDNSLSCQLLKPEPLSPITKHVLMSEADKMLIEDLLWQVEKHHTIISSVLLPEPQITRNRLHLKITAHHVREILKIEPFHLSDEEFRDSLCQLQHLKKAPLNVLEKYSMVPYQIMQLNPVKSESFSSFSINEINESNFLNAEIEESTASKETAHLQTKVVPDIYKQDKAGTLTTMTTTMCGTSQFQKTPTQHYGEHLECEQETSNPINPSVRKLNCEHQTKIIAKAHDAQKSLPEDLSPLADFILLRSKQLTITSPMVEVESSNSNNVNVESKVENHPIQMRKNNVTIEHLYIQADQQRTSTVIEVQASESQCRGYCMLHDVAVSVQTQLKDIGTDYNLMGNFAMLSFDKTRWFLKQHEKKVNNNMKEGKCSEVDIMLYKHSALVHLLVTVRDLLLACGLDAAVGYMTRAKDTYTSSLGACLNDVWRRLRVVQYFSQSTEEINPKIAELQKQMSKWIQRSISHEHDFKVLVIIRMDSDCVRESLINSLRQFTTLAATAILPEDSKTLDYNTVICCLQRHSCVVVCSQHLSANFPWNYFSLVVEYDYLEPSGWTHHCKDKDISHIAFKTVLPNVISNNIHSQGLPNETFKWNSSVLLMELEVPFVFLATEGLIRSSQLLQNLESRYNITILERSCPVSVQLFEGMLCEAIITVDESTAVVVQEIEQLTEEKAADCFILRMLALSLQYTCCWIILSVTDTSRYTFTGKVFCNLVLIYAALVLLGLKSEDLEIKVLISSNTAETAQLIHQIGSFTLMSSKTDPLIWLDRSWLSVVASEAEQCLLSFPCINSFAAQLMLKRTPSLDWLFAATHSELQEVLPEIPNKAIKLFTSTTALYKLNASHSPTPRESQEISGDRKESCSHCTVEKTFPPTLDVSAQQFLEDEIYSSQYRLEFSQKCDNCFAENQQIENLGISNYTKNDWRQKRISVAPLQNSNMVTQNISNSSVPNKDTCDRNQFVHRSPEKEYSKFTCCNRSRIFTKELQSSQGTNSQASVLPLKRPLSYKRQTTQSAVDFSVGGNVVYRLPSNSSPTQRDNFEFGYEKANSWNLSNLSPDCSRLHENIAEMRKGMFNGSENAGQLLFSPQQKRKCLTYEKIPGRSDGQTRLTFFSHK